MARLSLEQKIAQAHGAPSAADFRFVPGIPELCVPSLTVTNGPAGVGPGPEPLGNVPATALPAPIALAASWDPELARRYGDVQGAEMRAIGRNLIEAPDVDLARTPRNGRTFEAYGEDPWLAARLGAANVRAIQSHGVLAMAKHFVAYNQERDRFTVDVRVGERALRELYLVPFEAAVREAEVASVMCSYNRINGPFSCENGPLLGAILKGEWRFRGFVQSDFFAAKSAVPSALAGMDLEMPNGAFFGEPLASAVAEGAVAVSRLDDMLVRRYRQMIRLGVFDRSEATTPIPAAEHAAVAREIAAAGTVLLRNEGGLLPLAPVAIRRLAVLGPWSTTAATGGGGSSRVNPIRAFTPLDGIRARVGGSIEILADDGTDPAAAAALARRADVAVAVVGDLETEGRDRETLALPDGQDALVEAIAAANPRTVVVVHAGAPVLMPWRDRVAAILDGWYPGGEDGLVTAALLFGDLDPSGRLPITFPASDEDGPATTPERYPGVSGTVRYDEGLLVGYRWFQSEGVKPLFPFGFGLSYTSFQLGRLGVRLRHGPRGPVAEVSVDVENTGGRAGADVVQVYVSYPPEVGEPPLQLRGFQRVRLEPGARRRVKLGLGPRAFAHWDEVKGRWRIAPGRYGIRAGRSSGDLPLERSVELRSPLRPPRLPTIPRGLSR